MAKSFATEIVAAHRSPMNAKQWQLTLKCGHGPWVTQTSKPKTGKMVNCNACSALSVVIPNYEPPVTKES